MKTVTATTAFTGTIIATAALSALAASSPAAAQALDFTPFAGGSPAYTESKGTLNGQLVTIVRITAYYHQMDLPPHSAQPIGLEYFKYFIKDPNGNMVHCENWIKRIQADEAAWTKQKPTFPYLEINIAEGAKPVTVNGVTTFRGFDVRCWEAMDFGPPLY
jgi:hypothetical protein